MKMTMRLSKTTMIGALVVAFGLLFYSSKAMALSDAILKQRILSSTAQAHMLKSERVRVDVKNGAVVLSGTVPFYAYKMKYERIAWQTYGVVEVNNEVIVVPKYKVADSVIERKINEVLGAYRRKHAVEAGVQVKSGKVHLEGTFASPQTVFSLKHEIAEIEGVIAIEIHVSFIV